MGPKKEISRLESRRNVLSINDPINTETWKCVVVMAVERTSLDSFVLKNFMEEAANGRRAEIKVINFQDLVLNILKDFTIGELPFKYAFLLNFSSIFKDAAEYFKNKLDIPLNLLVKVVKALLFFLREENLQRTERKISGPLDSIKAMSERPTHVGNFESNKSKINFEKKKITESKNKQTAPSSNFEGGLKIRPPSVGKPNTKLLKRGETSKQDQWIEDAPLNSFFNLYILLIGFYNPKFPLELIKAKIPLHSILCIDSSSLIIKRHISTIQYRSKKQNVDNKSYKIQQFWKDFLNILWNPSFSIYFTEIIFQIFEPKAIICDKKNLKDFIYKEISFLMYDLTDYKKQHLSYLNRLKLWNVKDEPDFEMMKKYTLKLDNFPGECLTVPIILYYIIETVIGNEKMSLHFYDRYSNDNNCKDLGSPTPRLFESNFLHSVSSEIDSSNLLPALGAKIKEKDNLNFLNVYLKTKLLDEKYNLEGKNYYELSSIKNSKKSRSVTSFCVTKNQILSEHYQSGLFYSSCKKLKSDFIENKSFSVTVDFCLYPYLMTKIVCPFDTQNISSPLFSKYSSIPDSLLNKKSNYKLIDNIKEQMYKPHFTVTQGSRSVLKYLPYYLKECTKDFFCPAEYKIVTPEAIKMSSAPEFRVPPQSLYNISCLSQVTIPDKLIEDIDWNVFQNLENFLGSSLFLNVNGFDFVEELSKSKLLVKDLQINEEYNCVDHMYSILTDAVLVALHNRKNDSSIYHETFSNALKTKVGFRDFFEYILEDENHLSKTEAKVQDPAILKEKNDDLNTNKNSDNYKDSNFWSENSIKYKSVFKKDIIKANKSKEFLNKTNFENMYDEKLIENSERIKDFVAQENKKFFQVEGYDIEDTAVQFSGLKTIYYAQDCTLSLELIEKLYGNQTLGVHIRQGGHTLHLYSYVCPTPHLPRPYAYHFICNNGIILAFGKLFSENFQYKDLNESQESEILSELKNPFSHIYERKKNSGESFVNVVENEDVMFDLKLSTPNGLIIETIHKTGKPFYIKQHYSFQSYPKNFYNEVSRLFLPNKNLIKILKNGTTEILKTDTSLVFASLSDLIIQLPEDILSNKNFKEYNKKANNLIFTKYRVIDSTGEAYTIDNGKIIALGKFQNFQSTNLQLQQIFFQRKDNTNYVINSNGTLCVQFQDGTKISSSPFTEENNEFYKNVNGLDRDDDSQKDANFFWSDFVFIYEEVTFEHPYYATVIYNTLTEKWKILLPSDLSVTIEKKGNICAKIDKQTNLDIKKNIIEIKRVSPSEEWLCTATADLSVFEKQDEKNVYCKVEDSTGKSFIVESNSNYYVLPKKNSNEENKKKQSTLLFEKTLGNLKDSIINNISQHQGTFTRGTKLCRDSKYFVVRNDMTGLEIIHKEDVAKILTELNDEDVIFTKKITRGENLRCFILISPKYKMEAVRPKWEMASILPDAMYNTISKTRTFSTTYGNPPTWMHPFPKKKVKFKIPENFTCRVFVETKKTEFFPQMGSEKLQFCQLDDRFEKEESKIQWETGNVQDYLKKISAENQDLLRQMYISVIRELQGGKKKNLAIVSEKLQNYLALNKYYLNLQEHHKRCIKNHLIPVYFHHPAGMSWLILYDLITNLKFAKSIVAQPRLTPKLVFPSSTFTKSFYSDEEIEYNLSWCSEKSFSDLSYKSNLSVKSVPLLLKETHICNKEISSLMKAGSAPIFKLNEEIISHENFQMISKGLCEFKDSEIDLLMHANVKLIDEEHLLTLNDIFYLGLI